MRELKQEDPCELELGLELELEADDVEAAVAAVAAASEGQIPCSCCDVLLANAEELHGHQMQQHSLSELSLALITLRGLDLPLVQTEESESPAVFDDSSHLRSILLGQAVDRPHDCDSESTVTVNSEARMFSPSNSPEFVDTSDFKNISMWNNMESLTYSPNSYMEEKNYLNNLENKIEISKPNIGNNSQDSGCWSDYSSQGKRNEPIIAQRKRNKKYDDLDSRQFFCNLCDRRYKKKSHLERHFRVHTGIRPYECHVCQKRFAVRSILKQHIRVHTGERPFSCDICSQRFPQKSGLMTHMMLHNGKPFKCEYCVKSFVSNHKLMLHQRSHGDLVNGAPHQGPYCCPSCDMRFFTAGALAEHAKGHIVGNHPTAHSNAHGADDFTISEEAARTAVSAIGMINDQSPECQSEIPEYIEDALGYDYQSDTLDIVKNEIFEEDDLAPGFLCEARWGGIEDMCI